MNLSDSDHLSQDLIFRALDDELTTAERFEAEAHLAVCNECLQKFESLQHFSMQIEAAVQTVSVPAMHDVRRDLQRVLEDSKPPVPGPHVSGTMRRFGWGMGIAATLAFGVLLASRFEVGSTKKLDDQSARSAFAQSAPSIEIDGETFQSVPYSNSDLPMNTPHIVQMEVPISSLADAGIVLEPVMNRAVADNEGSVLADVLVGADGQPRGVHVLEFE